MTSIKRPPFDVHKFISEKCGIRKKHHDTTKHAIAYLFSDNSVGVVGENGGHWKSLVFLVQRHSLAYRMSLQPHPWHKF